MYMNSWQRARAWLWSGSNVKCHDKSKYWAVIYIIEKDCAKLKLMFLYKHANSYIWPESGADRHIVLHSLGRIYFSPLKAAVAGAGCMWIIHLLCCFATLMYSALLPLCYCYIMQRVCWQTDRQFHFISSSQSLFICLALIFV